MHCLLYTIMGNRIHLAGKLFQRLLIRKSLIEKLFKKKSNVGISWLFISSNTERTLVNKGYQHCNSSKRKENILVYNTKIMSKPS